MSQFPPPYQAMVGSWPRSLGVSSKVAIVGLTSTIVAAVSQLCMNGAVALDRATADELGLIHPTLIVALIFAGIAFISWLYRARVNLYYFGVPDLRWRSSWTIWSWFLPFVNFVIPLRVISEVDRASECRADAADAGRGRPPYGRAVFVGWAITWTSYLVLGRYTSVATPSLVDLSTRDLDRFTGLSVVSTALEIAAAVCAILLVRRVTANQDRVLASLGAALPPAGPEVFPPAYQQIRFPPAPAASQQQAVWPASPASASPSPASSSSAASQSSSPSSPPPAPLSSPQPAWQPAVSQQPAAWQQPASQQPAAWQQPASQQPVSELPVSERPPSDPWPSAGF
jgi:Domain of unknown function (DUF4328)